MQRLDNIFIRIFFLLNGYVQLIYCFLFLFKFDKGLLLKSLKCTIDVIND